MADDFHRVILERGDAAVLVVDPNDLGVRWTSPAARRLFGDAHGPFPDLVVASDQAAVGTFLQASREGASRCTCAVAVEGSTPRRVDLIVRSLPDVGLVVVALDVTSWAEQADELERKLTVDPLTGLANHAGFRPLLEVHGAASALVYMDLDGFKQVNDEYGHAVGDQVLRVFATRLSALTAGRGTAARLGGDEFVALLEEADPVTAVDEILQVLGTPFTMPHGQVHITASAGIAHIHPTSRPGELLRHADLAMYRAKALGPGRAVVYSDELEDWMLARKHQVDQLAERLEQLHAENRALAEAATTDQRTGLPNPAVFDADHARLRDTGDPYSLLLVDIDRFHSYNTIYRYLAGHETLRAIGQTISRTVRQGDRTYRYGGEEFTVLLPNARLGDAVEVGERIRREVQGLGVEHRGNPAGVVTVSVGAVEVRPGVTVTDAVEQASVAVLEAKDAGRNRVVGRVTSPE